MIIWDVISKMTVAGQERYRAITSAYEISKKWLD